MNSSFIKVIAAVEMFGGISGFLLCLWVLMTYEPSLFSIIVFIPLLFNLLSIIAGLNLWKEKPLGRKLSLIIQIIQLPKIVSPLIIMMFGFGPDLWIHILANNGSANLGFQFQVFGFFQLYFNVATAPTGVGISVTSLIFLAVLKKYNPLDKRHSTEPPLPPDFDYSRQFNDAQLNDEINEDNQHKTVPEAES